MFTISSLFSKDDDLEDQAQYTKVASLIEDGSVLDRRKFRKDRRSYIDRRKRLRESFTGLDRRCDENRRSMEGRRSSKSKATKSSVSTNSESSNKENIKYTQKLNEVDQLVLDQEKVIELLSGVSDSAKNKELQGLEDKIRDISFKIKSIKCEEEKLLYLSFDNNLNEKTNKSLSEILSYIHDISDQVLEYLDRYYYSGVTEANVGFFLLDMNIVSESLSNILNKKQNLLYPIYKTA